MKNRQTMMMVLLVITVVVYLAVDIAYRLIELSTPAPEPEPQAAAGAPATDMTKDPIEAYAVIVERNLFRTTDRPIAVDQMDPNSLEATTLQLDLYGTIAGEDGKGYAIIEERDKKRQRLYKVGDRVGGATIVRITRNAVVLRMGDRDQVLKKKEIASAGNSRQARPGVAVTPGAAPSPRAPSRPPAGGPPGSATDLAGL
ncbi:MAG: type II secretion system protein N, partial [Syntrophaceae bacterium]